MGKLKFKGFTWPRNPEVYQVSWTREPVYDEISGELTGMGNLKRVITGNGVFTGGSAFADFKRLEALCGEKTAGWLVHPVWGNTAVFLEELEMTQEPRENYVRYSFRFLGTADGTLPD